MDSSHVATDARDRLLNEAPSFVPRPQNDSDVRLGSESYQQRLLSGWCKINAHKFLRVVVCRCENLPPLHGRRVPHRANGTFRSLADGQELLGGTESKSSDTL